MFFHVALELEKYCLDSYVHIMFSNILFGSCKNV